MPRGRSPTPDAARILANAAIGYGGGSAIGECWIWLCHGRTADGYGTMKYRGRSTQAHRASFMEFVGPIPAGLELDHLCRRRDCVNPAHLEPVTHKENCRRGDAPGAVAQRTGRCSRGHDLVGAAYHRPDRPGSRACRACDRENYAKRSRHARPHE